MQNKIDTSFSGHYRQRKKEILFIDTAKLISICSQANPCLSLTLSATALDAIPSKTREEASVGKREGKCAIREASSFTSSWVRNGGLQKTDIHDCVHLCIIFTYCFHTILAIAFNLCFKILVSLTDRLVDLIFIVDTECMSTKKFKHISVCCCCYSCNTIDKVSYPALRAETRINFSLTLQCSKYVVLTCFRLYTAGPLVSLWLSLIW